MTKTMSAGAILSQPLGSGHERGSGVEQVVPTRHTDFQMTEDHPGLHQLPVPVESGATQVGEPNVGIRRQAVGHHGCARRPGHVDQRP